MSKDLLVVKSQDENYVAFVYGNINLVCVRLEELKKFLNDESKDMQRIKNEVKSYEED